MELPEPERGLVIRYSYLWHSEAREGREEGIKDRPCAIVIAVKRDEDGERRVMVVPITHAPPENQGNAVEVPADIGRAHLALGERSIDRCLEVTEWTLKEVYQQLYYARVPLEKTILKPNMVISGKKCPKQASRQEVAEKTVAVLKRCVPSAVPGIAFLSGGQSDEDATAHLHYMNAIGKLPWTLSFSYGRALQAAALKAWSGEPQNVAAGQRAFSHRAKMNGLAARGQWKPELEKAA